MKSPVFVKRYDALPIRRGEILRYAQCPRPDPETEKLLEACLAEAAEAIVQSVCYARYPASIEGDRCRLGFCEVISRSLAQSLAGCGEIVVFAATAGVGIYQLQKKYERLSPARALMLGAIGSERVETLCDAFCADYAAEAAAHGVSCRARFSPGYGDLTLAVQKEVFAALDPEKRIGVHLNEHCFMTPPKSVTAVFGLEKEPDEVTA